MSCSVWVSSGYGVRGMSSSFWTDPSRSLWLFSSSQVSRNMPTEREKMKHSEILVEGIMARGNYHFNGHHCMRTQHEFPTS